MLVCAYQVPSSLPSRQLSGELSPVNRHAPQRDSGRRKNGVSQCWHCRGRARFADATWRFTALDQMHVDHRYLVDAQHLIVVKIGLLHPALLKGDLTV